MSVALLHRRLAVGMSLAALAAFAGGAGASPLTVGLAAAGLTLALFWHPSRRLSALLEKGWLPLALLLVARALLQILLPGGDVVVPVVDLLLLLLCAEALRSLDAANDSRLYALSFALVLAATAYRPGIIFALGFTTYVLLAVATLAVGQLRRVHATHGVDEPAVGAGLLFRMAGLGVPVLLLGAVVFLAFPRASGGWNGRGGPTATSIAGFADRVSLGEHGSRIHPNPSVVLRVEFPEGLPSRVGDLHWRGRSYDHFDGTRWSRSRNLRPSAAPREWYMAWSDSLRVQTIYAAPLSERVMFTLHPLVDVQTRSSIHPIPDVVGDYGYWGRGEPVYSVTSVAGRPSPGSLRSLTGGYMPDRAYLQLPEVSERIAALADSVAAPAETRYDRAAAVERWLAAELGYTRNLPDNPREATLDAFLFDRREGHCEYFASAMVVMLRSLGIESRIVNGFLGGEWSEVGEYLVVTQNDAHSWVEAWFPGHGWVPFDPTPGAAAGSWSGVGFWPGRFLFDALQHRWSRWVLDYGTDEQVGLLSRLTREIRERTEGRNPAADGALVRGALVLVLLAGVAAGGVGLLRRRAAVPPESRPYLRLVSACRRAGVMPSPRPGPKALVGHLRAAGHPAYGPASRLVERYLRCRFGGEPLDAAARREMRDALREARGILRRR